MATCGYEKGLPHPCGKIAVAAVKISQSKAHPFDPVQTGDAAFEMTDKGLVLGSGYLPVCYEHVQMFPDYEGFPLTTG